MRAFLVRRLVMLVVSLFVASIAVYGALYLAPGDPISALTGGRSVSPQTRAMLRERYHLNSPFPVRYWDWLTGALRGDFGISIASREQVSTLIAQKAGTTLLLVGYSSIIILAVGIVGGILAGLRPGWLDSTVLVVTTVLAALPSFVAALVLIMVFAVNLRWLPALGDGNGFLDQVKHLTLPALALATTSIAFVARITRAAVREEMRREHVQTAVARGLPQRVVIGRHVLRNAAIPITTVSGVAIASLVSLVAIVEQAFNLNGLGAALVNAASSKDFAVVQAISLIMVAAFVLTNAAVDVLYAVLDPRVKLGTAAA